MNFDKGIGFSNEVTSSTIPTVSYPKTILSCPKTGLIFAVGRLLTTLYQYYTVLPRSPGKNKTIKTPWERNLGRKK